MIRSRWDVRSSTRAKHVQLGQDLAVKVLTGQQTLSRVLNEVTERRRGLTSEHVVRVHDVAGTTKAGFGYVVMEKLRGRDLSR